MGYREYVPVATTKKRIAPISDISLTPFQEKDTATGLLPPKDVSFSI